MKPCCRCGEDVRHWHASPRAAIGFLIHAATMDTARLGSRRERDASRRLLHRGRTDRGPAQGGGRQGGGPHPPRAQRDHHEDRRRLAAELRGQARPRTGLPGENRASRTSSASTSRTNSAARSPDEPDCHSGDARGLFSARFCCAAGANADVGRRGDLGHAACLAPWRRQPRHPAAALVCRLPAQRAGQGQSRTSRSS